MVIQKDVAKATRSIIRCISEACSCSATSFADMKYHRRAKVVYAETSFEQVSLKVSIKRCSTDS